MKKAILFDLDGTLIDSSPLHERAFRETLAAHDLSEAAGRFDYSQQKGCSSRDVFLSLGLNQPGQLQALVEDKQARYRNSTSELTPIAGASQLLTQLRSVGCSLFVVTGSTRPSAWRGLNQTGLLPFFQGLITAEDAPRGKPAPDLYLFALQKYGLTIAETLVVEDAASGVLAGRAAGLDVVMISGEAHYRPCHPDLMALQKALTCELFVP